MTAICAIVHDGTVWMGGDSAAVDQGHYLALAAAPKVFEVGPLVIGYTSSFRMGHALQHRLKVPDNLPVALGRPLDLEELDRWMNVEFMDQVRQVMRDCGYMKRDNEREQGGQFLVGVRGQLYFLDDDFHALRHRAPYAACGSGVSACLGALHVMAQLAARQPVPPAHMVRHALEAAEACVATVRGPFHVVAGGRV